MASFLMQVMRFITEKAGISRLFFTQSLHFYKSANLFPKNAIIAKIGNRFNEIEIFHLIKLCQNMQLREQNR